MAAPAPDATLPDGGVEDSRAIDRAPLISVGAMLVSFGLGAALVSTHHGFPEQAGAGLIGLGLLVAPSVGRIPGGDVNGGLKWTGVRFLLLLGGGAIGLAATQGGKSCDGLCTGSLATAAFAVGVTLLADGIWDVATTARDLREVRRGYRSRCSSPC